MINGTASRGRSHYNLSVIARCLCDRAPVHPLGFSSRRSQGAPQDELAQDGLHLELSEGGAEAAPYATAEGDPGVRPTRLSSLGLQEALEQELVRARIDVRASVHEVDRGRDRG